MLDQYLKCISHVNVVIEIVKDVALYAALLAAVIGGGFGFYSNRQLAKLGLMKSAFDVRFKEEFATYKFLWPSLQSLIITLSLETDGLIEKDGAERAAIIDRDLLPITQKLYSSSIFLPADIRKLAEIITKNAAGWRNNLAYPQLANPDIFTPPKEVGELEQDLICLRDMIAERIDMMPGKINFGTKRRRLA